MPLSMDADALRAFLADAFPQALRAGFVVDRVDESGVRLVLPVDDRHLRPGGTVMGPTLMMLADTATYLAVLAVKGPLALAVTSSLDIHFLRRARPHVPVWAEARLVKLGSRLAVASVELGSAADVVAVATVTYILPESP
jgi:uncharacterized protein (TIGR00369 family)